MPNVGPMELLFLGLLAVLIFGPAKLPEIGRSIGKATREFRDSVSGTGIQEAIDGVGDIRGAMTPTNLAKAAIPEMASGVADVKETFTDPLGTKKAAEEAESAKTKPAAAAAVPVASAASEPPAE